MKGKNRGEEGESLRKKERVTPPKRRGKKKKKIKKKSSAPHAKICPPVHAFPVSVFESCMIVPSCQTAYRGARQMSHQTCRSGHATRCPLPLGFSQVLILKVVKLLCFDALLQLLILKVVS